jgi:hypothetical protein
MLRTVTATRYVTPLREGGSLPAIMEADDDGLYVVKFRGAGHGARGVVAELIAGELARALGLPVPELVFIDVDVALGKAEADPEIQALVVGSAGVNIAFDFLPGSLTYDPASDDAPSAELAADIVWLDSLVTNIDRMPQNPNLLMWHGNHWLIDHGAALYVHSNWHDPAGTAAQAFAPITQHVLLPVAGSIADADARLAPKVTRELLEQILASAPDDWLEDDVLGRPADEVRTAYVEWLLARLEARATWVAAAEAGRA